MSKNGKKVQRFCSVQCGTNGRNKPLTVPKRKRGNIYKCQWCKQDFYLAPSHLKRRGSGKYCSRECTYNGLKLLNINCPVCKKEFKPKNSKSLYCSKECSVIGIAEKRKNGKTIKCEWCKKEYYLPAARLKTIKNSFCSLDCQNKWQRRNKKECICKICQKVFFVSPSASRIYCSIACRDKDPLSRTRLLEMNKTQQNTKINKLEKTGYSILDELKILYEKQYLIGDKFLVDAFIPSHKIVIQFDGDYWHCNPIKFVFPDKRQQKRIYIDTSQNAYFKACGYSVLRFWETDIYKNKDFVIRSILSTMDSL
jgi:very-short-patch-repair endonuclease